MAILAATLLHSVVVCKELTRTIEKVDNLLDRKGTNS